MVFIDKKLKKLGVKNKFLTSVKATVGIGTEVVESEEGRGKINVSTIDIHLIK